LAIINHPRKRQTRLLKHFGRSVVALTVGQKAGTVERTNARRRSLTAGDQRPF
jgi:hypothetical protein